jgi:hypothetical protein
MKKIFILPTVISVVMICSCQKQDSVVEQQLAQRNVELDARENALDEREKDLNLRETALNERENALAKKEKAANARTIAPNVQPRNGVRDAADAKAERDKRIQQLPPEIRSLIPDSSQLKAERDARIQELLGKNQQMLDELQKARMSGVPASPAAGPTTPK